MSTFELSVLISNAAIKVKLYICRQGRTFRKFLGGGAKFFGTDFHGSVS
jgi:hypothetical protein